MASTDTSTSSQAPAVIEEHKRIVDEAFLSKLKALVERLRLDNTNLKKALDIERGEVRAMKARHESTLRHLRTEYKKKEEFLEKQLRTVSKPEKSVEDIQHGVNKIVELKRLTTEIQSLKSANRSLQEKLKVAQAAECARAAELRAQCAKHAALEQAARRDARAQCHKLLEEIKSKERVIMQLKREAARTAASHSEQRLIIPSNPPVKVTSNFAVRFGSTPKQRLKMLLTALLTIVLLHTSTSINPECALYKEIFDYHNETYFKAEFAFEVVEKIFNAFKQWFFTVTYCDFTYFENRILKYIENYDYGYPVMLLNGCRNSNKTKVKPKINRHGQTAYVVTSEELSLDGSEFVIETFTRTGVFKPRSTVIFVISTPIEMDSYFFYNMKQHFQFLISRRITNSVMVLYSGRLRMFTFNPFSNEIRDITDVSEVSRLLAKQHNDLFGHELRLSVFRKIYVSDDTGPLYCNSRLAKTVMEILNATCKPLPPRDGNTVGDLLANGTATGVTADLIDGYTDLELSSRILKNSYYGYIDTTYPLVQDELCFLVKKSLKQSTFTTTLKLISINMLIVFIFNVVFLITAALSTRAIEKRVWNLDEMRTTSSTIVDLIKCFIRQTVDIKFMGHIFRFIALLIMMYSLVVNCAIDGIITSAITYPRYKPDINTLSDLAQTNLTFAVHNRDIRIYKKSLSSDYYNTIKRIEVFNDVMIKEAIIKRQFQYAILLRKSEAQYISRKQSNMNNGRPLFHTVEECPVPCSIVYGLRYGSPYLPTLNKVLHHLNQAGILQYWSRSEEYTLYRTNIKKFLFTAEHKEKKPLNTGNVKEIFIVLLVGTLFSIFTFVFEFLFYHIERFYSARVNTTRFALLNYF